MDKKILIELAKDVYKLTVLFPNKEPLRYRIREAADEIAAVFIARKNDYLVELRVQLEIIDSYFEIALNNDWTAPAKITQARDKYAALAGELQEEERKMIPPVLEMPAAKNDLNPKLAAPLVEAVNEIILEAEIKDEIVSADENQEEDETDAVSVELTNSQIVRQNRISEFLKEKGGAQVWEIQKIFPDISKRTIRRDFRSMLKQGLIERTGERNTTAYKLKINIS